MNIYDEALAKLAELRAVMEAGTPGPWEASKAYRLNVVAPEGKTIGRGSGSFITDAAGESFNSANALLIVAAVNALPGFLALAETVLGRHVQILGDTCRGCRVALWPCAEAKAVLAALGVTP